MAETIYILCGLASLLCAAMLFRGYFRSRARLLLWSSLCFAGLALNNLLLSADKMVFPEVDLSVGRTAVALAAIGLLVFGLVWDAD